MIDRELSSSAIKFPSSSHRVSSTPAQESFTPAFQARNNVGAFSTTTRDSPASPPNFTPSPNQPSSSRGKSAARASGGSGLHICPDCQRQYSRSEHLARHIQSHTLGKRFQCPECGKAFARTDLLRRHVQSHQNHDGSKRRRKGLAAVRTARVSHACKQCSTARVKCEEAKPCMRCRLRNLTCEYNASEAALALCNPHLKSATPSRSATSSPVPFSQSLLDECAPEPELVPEPTSTCTSTVKQPIQPYLGEAPTSAPRDVEGHRLGSLETPMIPSSLQPPSQARPSSELFDSNQPFMPANHNDDDTEMKFCALPTNINTNLGTLAGSEVAPAPVDLVQTYENGPLPHNVSSTQQTSNGFFSVPEVQNYQYIHTTDKPLVMDNTMSPFNDMAISQTSATQAVPNQMAIAHRITSQRSIPNSTTDAPHMPISDLLRNVIYEPQMNLSNEVDTLSFPVLDFCTDTNLDLNEADYGLLDYLNVSANQPLKEQPPSDEVSPNLKKFRQEVSFLWSCTYMENYAGGNPHHIELDDGTTRVDGKNGKNYFSLAINESRKKLQSIISDKISSESREAMMSLISRSSNSSSIPRKIFVSFPSLEAIDGFAHIYLASHLSSPTNFIHLPTIKLNSQSLDWIAAVVAFGAVLTPVPTIRRFGFAIQQTAAFNNAIKVEKKTGSPIDIDLLQATVILQDMGIWSGNRAKMTAVESHASFPITMLRYLQKFQRLVYPTIQVDPNDSGQVLQEKWEKWSQQESWKRLVFHCSVRDSEMSTLSLSNPLVSYYELDLPLPESQDIWLAKSAEEWKTAYLKRWGNGTNRLPCIADIIRDKSTLTCNLDRLDVQFSVSVYLAAMASSIYQYHQFCGIHCCRPFMTRSYVGRPQGLLNERHQQLSQELQHFIRLSMQWNRQNSLMPQQNAMLHFQMMLMYVSLEDLHLFTGKLGDEKIRQVYPILQQWAKSTEAREALWHAGQTLRYTKMFPPGTLRDFWSIATLQAGLTFWVFGIITKASKNPSSHENKSGNGNLVNETASAPHIPGCYVNEPLFLNGEDSTAVMRYLSMGQGRPFIRGPTFPKSNNADACTMLEASIEDPRACMDVAHNILVENFSWDIDKLPPLVYNLSVLMKRMSAIAIQVHH
ncbi:hypothetical protein BROUX41_004979 [Berkeleyomyces rouxiae]|uniref:uncharacterized protein n=1 Tax=Berkeleyomyces rouxiae TaxID=2035830 RepID=UPI003B7BF391